MIVTTLLVVVVLLTGAFAILVPGTGALTGYCITPVHCKVNECCVSFAQLRGRRDVGDLSPELKAIVKGKCEPKGQRGAACYVRPMKEGPDRYYNACPCAWGWYCRGNGVITNPLGQSGVCFPVRG